METMEDSPSSHSSSRVMDDVDSCTSENNINNKKEDDDIDIDELLARPRHRRGLFRRQKASFNKAPEFVKRLSPFEEAKAGSTVVFSCQWQALPRPTVKWYKDDEEMSEDNNNRVQFVEGDKGELQLVINNCRKLDEAAYKCKAENTEGVASTTGYLSVTGDVKDKPLSAQPRKNAQHAVSNAPRLRAIVEQKSLELREEEECSSLPPSPIHEYVETFQKKHKISAKQKSPPLPLDDLRQGDEYDSGSDTSVESQDFDRIRMSEIDSDIMDRELTPELEVANLRSEVRQQEEDGRQIPNSEAVHPVNGEQSDPTGYTSNREVTSDRVTTVSKKTKKKRAQNGHTQTQTATVDVKYVSNFAYAKIQSPVLYGPVTSPAEQPQLRSANVNDATPPAKILANLAATGNTTAKTSATATNQTALEFPWLFAAGSASVGTLVATATDMSPTLFVLLLAVISMLSFRFLITTKTQPT